MITTTKKMRADLRKLREQDLVVCDECGSEDVAERMWVDSNSYMSIDRNTYYKYSHLTDKLDCTDYWCEKCNDETQPVPISEWEEIRREKK